MAVDDVHEWVTDGIRMVGQEQDDGMITVKSPDMVGLQAAGKGLSTAQNNTRDALGALIEYFKKTNAPLPPQYSPQEKE